jgi:hypothetical protein
MSDKTTVVPEQVTKALERMEKDTLSKKVDISLDTVVEDVLQYDQDEKELIFDTNPGRFKELPEDVIRKLGKANRDAYFAAFYIAKTASKQEDFRPTPGLSITPNYASATEQINVILPEVFKKKYHTCWKRPDQLPGAERNGYFVVRGSHGVESFHYDRTRDCHVIGSAGHVEQILMACPIETYQKILKAVEEKSALQSGKISTDAKQELKDLGGKPFEGEYDGLGFTETRKG